MHTSTNPPDTAPNPVKRAAAIWWVVCALTLAGIFTPSYMDLFSVEAGDWVFAVMFFCLVFGITFIFVAVMYTKRARLVSRMLDRENLLAHWTYSPTEWSHYAQKEHEENKREKKNLFLLIAGISVVIGIIMFIVHPDGGFIFLFTVTGIIAVVGGAALLSILLPYRQHRQRTGEVYVSPEGVYLNRILHSWQGFGAALEEVSYQSKNRAQPLLKIGYSVPNRNSRNHVTVRVPVPRGKEAEAEKVAEILLQQLEDTPPGRNSRRRKNEVI